MKTGWIAMLMVGLAVAASAPDADAGRLAGGRPAGMQRATPDKAAQTPPAAPTATPNAQNNAAAAPANAGANAAATQAPKRSWMGPLAGLAAGLGLAALFSHLGWGEGLANIVMVMLLALVAVVAIRWVARRFGGAGARNAPFAMAGTTGGMRTAERWTPTAQPLPEAAAAAPQLAPPAMQALGTPHAVLPADFDAAAFARIAKTIFIRLQAANDAADLNDLRAFTTPELFASLRLDLQERSVAPQRTDVVTLNAELLDFAQEAERQIVSVRFHGLIREEADGGSEPFDEVWHMVRPNDDSRSWAIAGIQPLAATA
jgi:predicted lipid-binding transport protein (Tim44 family)